VKGEYLLIKESRLGLFEFAALFKFSQTESGFPASYKQIPDPQVSS
jgi:hypothetical protein